MQRNMTHQRIPAVGAILIYPLALVTVALVTVALVTVAGCGSKQQQARELQTSHLRTLIMFYNTAGRSLGHAPDNEAQLREYIEAHGKPALEKVQITSIDELFRSERDGQPFVVVYRKRPKGIRQDVVAYEQTGVDGKRQVGFDLGMIEEFDSVEFEKLIPSG
jgi:hypothetical protein